MARRYARIQCIVPWELAHDIFLMVEGKVTEWNMVPVKHGGEGENGALQAMPPVRDVILAFASSQETFRPRDLKEVLVERGRSTTNVYTQLASLVGEGVVKRVDEGVYALASHKKPAKQSKRGGHLKTRKAAKTKKAASPLKGRHDKIGTNPDSMSGFILGIIKKKQNGTGDGVSLDIIKDAISAADRMPKSKNVSPAITDLLRAKKIARVSPAHYRTVEA